MAERVALDPTEVATGRTEFDISDWITDEGVDWGDAEIAQYLAEANRGQRPVDYRVPNRTINIPLTLMARGTVTFEQARSKFQQKVGRIQQEGGWLRRITNGGGTVFADLTNATLKLGGGWDQAHKSYDQNANLILEAIPDFYGAEVDLGDNSTTTLPELIFTDTGVQGDYPGRVRLVVDEDDAEYQLGMIWGYRSRHYSSAATARLSYEAEALEKLSGATNSAGTTASGGTFVLHGTASTNWLPVLSANLGGTAFLTHTGSYRVWARVASNGGTAMQTRFVWDVGDLASPVENAPYTLRQDTLWEMADLGEIRLDPVPSGTHRWAGQVQAKGAVGSETFQVDKIFFQPLDEGAGKLVASQIGESFMVFSARDEFNQSAGALTGETAPTGGVWVGAGDTDDFSVETTGLTAQRTAVSDSANVGRACTLNTNMTDTIVQVDTKQSTIGAFRGVIARYVDASNFLRVHVSHVVSTAVNVEIRIAGVVTSINSTVQSGLTPATDWSRLRLMVLSNGTYHVWVARTRDAAFELILSGYEFSLETGQTHATGDVGIYDAEHSGVANTRNYDNFAAWVPTRDAVMFPSQSLELRSEGMFREDSTGSAYGPVPIITGDLPRVPVSGMENRTVETFLKASRGDFDTLPDAGIDDISARPFYRPCWLFVPGS